MSQTLNVHQESGKLLHIIALTQKANIRDAEDIIKSGKVLISKSSVLENQFSEWYVETNVDAELVEMFKYKIRIKPSSDELIVVFNQEE